MSTAEERRLLRHVNKKMPENIPDQQGFHIDGKWHVKLQHFPIGKDKPLELHVAGKQVYMSPGLSEGDVLPETIIEFDLAGFSSTNEFLLKVRASDDLEIIRKFTMESGGFLTFTYLGSSVNIQQQTKPWGMK